MLLKILMNVLIGKTTPAIHQQHAQTVLEATLVPANLDTMEMVQAAMVSMFHSEKKTAKS